MEVQIRFELKTRMQFHLPSISLFISFMITNMHCDYLITKEQTNHHK